MREMPDGQFAVMGAIEKAVDTFDDIFLALMDGQRTRAVAGTQ